MFAISICFKVTVFSLLFVTQDATSENEQKLPTFARTITLEHSLYMPVRGAVPHKRTNLSSRELLKRPKPRPRDQVCSRVMRDGVLTYDILHEGKPLTIEIHQGGSIEITLRQTIHRDKLQTLEATHPDIAKDFEKHSDQIVFLEIESTYTSLHEEQLKRLYPKVFEIYSRYHKNK